MLKKKPVRYKTNGETDYSFLAPLPQTLFYKVCRLTHHLLIRCYCKQAQLVGYVCVLPVIIVMVAEHVLLQIVAMETELKKTGKLNSVQDVKEFWDNMLAPPGTIETGHKSSHAPYKHCKQSVPSLSQWYGLVCRIVFCPAQPVESMCNEVDEEEHSDDVTNSWAITATVPTSNSMVLNPCYP